MAGSTGSAVIDFGALPGSNEASVTVSQPTITAGAKVEAFFMATVASADHTTNDHAYVGVFSALTCTSINAGVDFAIKGVSSEKLTGEWNVEWVWSD